MSLDITFTRKKNIICPHCGEVTGQISVEYSDGGGRGWYPLLESLGYYVPLEQRTEANDWCGKDMVLTHEQIDEAYSFVKKHDLYGSEGAQSLLAKAMCEKDIVAVYADW
jgi:hypothetical protein